MAKEIEWADDTGLTEYVNLVNAVGQWWNTVGAAFEAFNAANWTDYDLAGTEFGSSGVYTADMPAVAAGIYNLVARRRAGGSPAQSDIKIGTGSIEWTGSLVGSIGRSLPAPAPGVANGLLILGLNTAGIDIEPTSGPPLRLLAANDNACEMIAGPGAHALELTGGADIGGGGGSGLYAAGSPGVKLAGAGATTQPGLVIIGDTGADAVQIGNAYAGSDSGGVSIGSDGGPVLSLVHSGNGIGLSIGTAGVGLSISGDSTGVSISSSAGNGLNIASTSPGGDGAILVSSQSGLGLSVSGPTGGVLLSSTAGSGMAITGGAGAGSAALSISGTQNSLGLSIQSGGGVGQSDAIRLQSNGTGAAIRATAASSADAVVITGGASGGNGVVLSGGQVSGNGSGLVLTGRLAGSGADLVLTNSDAPTLAAAVWGFVVDSIYTASEVLRGISSFVMGKSTGGGVGPIVFRDVADTKDRVILTVDALGNRTAVTRDLT